VTKAFCRDTAIALGLVWMLLTSTSVFADQRFYRLEIGVQAGAGYYMGELAEYAFMSPSESYGFQLRCKIDERWALQFKGQRQRVINTIAGDNEWGVAAGRYQTPMWHFDVTGEYNFFHFGLDEYDVRMHPVTPFIFLGIGMTAYNELASSKGDYPLVGWKTATVADGKTTYTYHEPEFAMYIPVGVGLKWKVAERWQLQLLWQHELYVLNGDGLEGVLTKESSGHKGDVWLNNSHNINGINVFNNDVTSTLTAGVVFEFGHKKKKCLFCIFDN
jgi:hypothetical protein